MNMALSVWDFPNPRLSQKSRTDAFDGIHGRLTLVGPWCSVLPSKQLYSPAARHQGMANIAFLDGHVEAFYGDDIGCGAGDPKRPDVRWTPPTSTWMEP